MLLIPQFLFTLGVALADCVARCFPARHRTGNQSLHDGLDVPDSDHLSPIDRALATGLFANLNPYHATDSQLPARLD